MFKISTSLIGRTDRSQMLTGVLCLNWTSKSHFHLKKRTMTDGLEYLCHGQTLLSMKNKQMMISGKAMMSDGWFQCLKVSIFSVKESFHQGPRAFLLLSSASFGTDTQFLPFFQLSILLHGFFFCLYLFKHYSTLEIIPNPPKKKKKVTLDIWLNPLNSMNSQKAVFISYLNFWSGDMLLLSQTYQIYQTIYFWILMFKITLL